MLTDRRCATMIPASDLDRAKKWYSDMLGFKPKSEDPGGIEYEAATGSQFWIYPSQYAGTSQATAMGFLAKDLSVEMDDLRSRGVKFEEYDIPGVKTTNGVAQLGPDDRGAWFKDSEGNILAMFESPRYN